MTDGAREEPRPAPLYAGAYELREKLGEGGTGTVHRAVHATLQQERALKILHRRPGAPPAETLERLRLEASVFGRLRGNPNLVMPLDVGFDAETQTHFLAMELLRGQSLGDWVRAHGPLGVCQTLGILRQVASGVDAAHAYVDEMGRRTPIVHRDLTPSNVFLIDPRRGHPQVKILDFGLAALLARGSGTRQGASGTALYRAYEQANELELVPQTDIWALGLVAHYALTGTSYWRARMSRELHEEITTAPLEPPSHRLAERALEGRLPEAFDAWFLRCLQRLPSRRFPTAGEAINELELALRLLEDLDTPLVRRHEPESLRIAGATASARSVTRTAFVPLPRTRQGPESHEQELVDALCSRLHPLSRSVLRLADDLMTAAGHYLAFPPDGDRTLEKQLAGVAHSVRTYNAARERLGGELSALEELLRELCSVAPFACYEAAREALAATLVFPERFPEPVTDGAIDRIAVYSEQCGYWQAERVLLQAQLEVGRIKVRELEGQVEALCLGRPLETTVRREASENAQRLFRVYVEAMACFERAIGSWLDPLSHAPAELRDRAWRMAPAIERMNDAYAALEADFLALRVRLCGSLEARHRMLADALVRVHDFQWYECRPRLNGPLVLLIRFLSSENGETLVESLHAQRERWQRLAQALGRGISLFGVAASPET